MTVLGTSSGTYTNIWLVRPRGPLMFLDIIFMLFTLPHSTALKTSPFRQQMLSGCLTAWLLACRFILIGWSLELITLDNNYDMICIFKLYQQNINNKISIVHSPCFLNLRKPQSRQKISTYQFHHCPNISSTQTHL